MEDGHKRDIIDLVKSLEWDHRELEQLLIEIKVTSSLDQEKNDK
jgi:hypothetical protein